MPITLGSNILSLRAQRSLAEADTLFARASLRLGSGSRINTAADDAAGLAISSSLGAKQRILTRAHRNIADGLSALEIAEGTLGSVSSLLTRMAELAQQAANGSFSTAQRRSLNAEYQQLDLEIRRIARGTSFNGIALFGGTKSTAEVTTLRSGVMAMAGASADGRYAATAGNTGLIVHDTITGTSAVIEASAMLAGTDIVVTANGDVIYSRGNELYRYDRTTGVKTQLTRSAGAEVYNGLGVSGDGKTVVFTSFTTYADGQLLNQSTGYTPIASLYSLDLETGIVRLVQTNMSAAERVHVSEDGSEIALALNAGLAGYDLLHISMDGGAPSINTVGTSDVPTYVPPIAGVTNDGRIFFSTYSDFTGQNPLNLSQVFEYSSATDQIRQLTAFTGGDVYGMQLSSDDASVYVFSDIDITGENPLGSHQLFRLETDSGGITQLTNFGELTVVAFPQYSISRDGSRVFFLDAGSARTIDAAARELNMGIETGSGASGVITALVGALEGSLRGLGGFSLGSRAGALGALDGMLYNLTQLTAVRGVLGAAGSRLQSARTLTAVQADQAAAARSRIADADVADEAARIVRASILRDTTAAILAQANQQPALALTLLER